MIQKNSKEKLENILEFTLQSLLVFYNDLELLQKVVDILVGEINEKV